jgi:hypothetical protein
MVNKGRRKFQNWRKEIIIKLVPVLGSLILFSSWVFQQTWLGEANSKVQRLDNAQSIFQTYQVNNALFNAIVETTKNNNKSVEEVRRFQLINYERGLRALETLLVNQEKANIPKPPKLFDGGQKIGEMMSRTQERVDKIQEKLEERKKEINNSKSAVNATFLTLYTIGSLTVLMGSVLNSTISSKSRENTSYNNE